MHDRLVRDRKRIILFDFANLGFGGGCEKHFMRLGIWFADHDYAVEFITPSPSMNRITGRIPLISCYPENISREDLVKQLGTISYRTFDLKDILTRTQKYHAIRETLLAADVIISKNEIFEAILLRYFFRINLSKVVFGFHTAIHYPYVKSLKSRVHNLIYNSSIYFWLLRSSHVRCLVLTNHDKRTLERLAPTFDVAVVPNPMDTNHFSQKKYEKGKHFKVYYIGRMTEQKGIDILAKAIDQLSSKPEFRDMEFHFVGTGAEEGILKQFTKWYDNCIWHGFQTNVVSFYQHADVTVVPSRWEGFPYTVLEAQSCGVPVIASDIFGCNDIVRDTINGWLTKPVDPADLATKILMVREMWYDNYANLEEIGKSARNIILEAYDENALNIMIESFIFRSEIAEQNKQQLQHAYA